MLKRYFCILIFSISTDLIADTKINIASRDDFNAIYAIDMIKLALQKAEYPYVLDIERGIHSNDRLEKDLSEGLIDIFWSATNAKLEQQLIPIRVPLYKGLLGHRILVIHNDNKNLFSNVVGLNELRKFNFGQGRDWSDTEILKANGLKVTTGTYEGLFMMTDGKRFDAFPRGILEPWAELATKKDLNAVVNMFQIKDRIQTFII